MSRCIFVYAEEKRNFVAYPGMAVAGVNIAEMEANLTQDLSVIAALSGEFGMTQEAVDWGTDWYQRHFASKGNGLMDDSRFGGYVARKQTHIHKLAMILSASRSDDLVISAGDLEAAEHELTLLEEDLPKVFDRVGKSSESVSSDRLLELIQSRRKIEMNEAYNLIRSVVPRYEDFEALMRGLIQAKLVAMKPESGSVYLFAR